MNDDDWREAWIALATEMMAMVGPDGTGHPPPCSCLFCVTGAKLTALKVGAVPDQRSRPCPGPSQEP